MEQVEAITISRCCASQKNHEPDDRSGSIASLWQRARHHGKLIKLKSAKSPFAVKTKDEAVTTWVKPKLVAEVKFTEWTSSGEMRHPVYLGLRADKQATKMVRERETPRP
jgi:ATP-dependent DNA ligase